MSHREDKAEKQKIFEFNGLSRPWTDPRVGGCVLCAGFVYHFLSKETPTDAGYCVLYGLDETGP